MWPQLIMACLVVSVELVAQYTCMFDNTDSWTLDLHHIWSLFLPAIGLISNAKRPIIGSTSTSPPSQRARSEWRPWGSQVSGGVGPLPPNTLTHMTESNTVSDSQPSLSQSTALCSVTNQMWPDGLKVGDKSRDSAGLVMYFFHFVKYITYSFNSWNQLLQNDYYTYRSLWLANIFFSL